MKTFVLTRIKSLLSILSAIILCSTFSGCQKSPINGDLDGFWQVMKVSPEPTEQIITERMYMCFYMHVVQLNYVSGGGWTAGNMHHEGNTLTMDFPYAIDNTTATAMLRQYGINSNPVAFEIETLTKDKLVLRDGETVVELRKF